MSDANPEASAQPRRQLLLITGTGRSGTSSMSGMLHHLGLHVPGPFLGANESNPKGFYESRWSVKFHNALFADAGTNLFDTRPNAPDLVASSFGERRRTRLREFVATRTSGQAVTVVKDPRTVWTQRQWLDACATLDIDAGFISMLRHPAEVVSSRTTYYSKGDDPRGVRDYQVSSLARWVNNALVNERGTRGHRRLFVRYDDLLADWRAVAAQLASELEVEFPVPALVGKEHPVDAFIDAGLQRHRSGWDDVAAPDGLRELAESVWQSLNGLASDPDSRGVRLRELDDHAMAYRDHLADSAAIAADLTSAAVRAREAAAAAEGAPPRPDQAVAEIPGRDLLREVGRRARRRITRK